jgi:isoquinoline 1-oxidoreductase subunit beta
VALRTPRAGLADAQRRRFLAAAGLATGALVLPVRLFAAGRDSTAPWGAYLRLAPDGSATVIVGRAEMGQGIYTGFAQLVAEELDLPWSQVRVESAPVDAAYNVPGPETPMQYTGGSLSLTRSYQQMREAGAAARSMLLEAASDRLAVPVATLSTREGRVRHAASGRELPYGELVAAAARKTPPRKVALKRRADFRLIGQPLTRIDTAAKTDGSAVFGLDVRLPGMRYAVVAHPPAFGARLASVGEAKARAVPGVESVVRLRNGAAVIASNTWAARQGRDALELKWQEAAPFQSAARAAAYAELAQRPGLAAREDGDVGAHATKKRVAADYVVPYLAHAPLEPLNCAAQVSASGCELWVGTQFQSEDRTAVAKLLGLKPAQVRIHTQYLGGAFGRRANPVSDFVVLAAEVARHVSYPVLTVWTREDEMKAGFYRPQAHNRLVATLGADGYPVTWTHTQVTQPVNKGSGYEKDSIDKKTGLDVSVFEGALEMPYRCANVRVDAHEMQEPVPVQWWRSVGHSVSAFAVESFIDECAHAAGRDPVAYRLALLTAQPRHAAALKLAAAKAGWGGPLPKGRARGVAVHETYDTVVAEVAEVSVEAGAVRVHRVVAAVHCGLAVNPAIVAAQVEGAICYGLSAALNQEITVRDGRTEQSNFDDYEPLRLPGMPLVETYIVPSHAHPTGIGEPPLPPIAPAVANALFALTGERVRRLPLRYAKLA